MGHPVDITLRRCLAREEKARRTLKQNDMMMWTDVEARIEAHVLGEEGRCIHNCPRDLLLEVNSKNNITSGDCEVPRCIGDGIIRDYPEHYRWVTADDEAEMEAENVKTDIRNFCNDLSEQDDEIPLLDGFWEAFVGVASRYELPSVACYDYDKCVEVLVRRDGMTEKHAQEHMDLNIVEAAVGEKSPVFLTRFTADVQPATSDQTPNVK